MYVLLRCTEHNSGQPQMLTLFSRIVVADCENSQVKNTAPRAEGCLAGCMKLPIGFHKLESSTASAIARP